MDLHEGKEMIDAVSEDGEFIQSLTREQIHAGGYFHRTIHVWIMNESKTKDNFPGLWDVSVAGHLGSGESSIEGALRECEEELGLMLDAESLKHIFSCKQINIHKDGVYIDRELVDVYLVTKSVDLSEIKIQEDEVDEVAYRPWNEVKKMQLTENSGAVPIVGTNAAEYAKFWDYIERISQ